MNALQQDLNFLTNIAVNFYIHRSTIGQGSTLMSICYLITRYTPNIGISFTILTSTNKLLVSPSIGMYYAGQEIGRGGRI